MADTFETDVIIDADGSSVTRAFDVIDQRIQKIGAVIDQITARSTQAVAAFGGVNAKNLRELSQTLRVLDQAEKLAAGGNFDAHVQARVQAERKVQTEVDQAYKQRENTARAAQNKRAQQEATLWAAQERSAISLEQKKEQLAERRWAVERERETRLQREADKGRLSERAIGDDNRWKRYRENMRAEVENAGNLVQLDNQRTKAAQAITVARGNLGRLSAEDERSAHRLIAVERERARLVEAREKALLKENRPNQGALNAEHALTKVLARDDERRVTSALTLNQLKIREAEISAAVTTRARESLGIGEAQARQAKRLISEDEARLVVIRKRISELQRELDLKRRLSQPQPGVYGPGNPENKGRVPIAPGPPQPPSVPPANGGGDGGLFGSSGLTGVVARTAAYGAAAAAIYGTIAALRDGVTEAIKFEDSLKRIQAVAGLTNTQAGALGESIREVARSSRYATSEIADATMVLVQAGFSSQDVKVALEDIANLAAASGTTFAETTDVVTGAVGAFQLQASEIGNVSNILSAALNTTKLNMNQVALGIQYAGATAFEQKISFDELTATFATMAQAGIRSGSTMGTGMRRFLVDIQEPTEKLKAAMDALGLTMEDLDVKSLGVPEVLRRMTEAGFDASTAYGTLETRSAAAYVVLRNNQDLLNEQIVTLNLLGDAAGAAEKAQSSLAAEWQQFKNSLNEAVADGVEPYTVALTVLLAKINEGKEVQAGYNDATEDMKASWNGVNPTLGLGLKLMGALAQSTEDGGEATSDFAAAAEEAQTAVQDTTEALVAQNATTDAANDAIARLVAREDILRENKSALSAETASLQNRFATLSDQLVLTTNDYEGLLGAMRAVRQESLQLGALRAGEQNSALTRSATLNTSAAEGALSDRDLRRLPQRGRNAYAGVRVLLDSGRGVSPEDLDAANRDLGVLRGLISQGKIRDPKLEARLNDFQGYASRAIADRDGARKALVEASTLNAMGSRAGQFFANRNDEVSKQSREAQQANIDDLYRRAGLQKSQGSREAFIRFAQAAELARSGYEAPDKPKKAGRSGGGSRAADRAEREAERRAKRLADQRLKTADYELDGTLDDAKISSELGFEPVRDSIKKAEVALENWKQARLAQMELIIGIDDMSIDEATGYRVEVERELQQKSNEFQRGVFGILENTLDMATQASERTYTRLEAEADQQLALVEAKASSLQRATLDGKVPDYVSRIADRKVAQAKDARDLVRVSNNERLIADLQKQLQKAREDADRQILEAEAAGYEDASGAVAALNTQMHELTLQIRELGYENEALKASFQGAELVPKSVGDGLRLAMADYREAAKLGSSFAEMVNSQWTDAITTAHGAVEGFFTDLTSGTVTVAGAFANMAQSIVKYLQQILVKMIAVKIMQQALNLFGGGRLDRSDLSDNFDISNIDPGSLIGRYRGGLVDEGVSHKDSVMTALARGEYVVRKSAVDSVGRDFLDNLNTRGAQAVDSGGTMLMPQPAHQEMKVFVVAEGQKPQLGPNDVLVVVSEDMAKGGQTAKLIKHIAQGG